MKRQKSQSRKNFSAKLKAIVGEKNYSTRESDLLSYSRDPSSRMFLSEQQTREESPPAIIVWPQNTTQVSQLIKLATEFSMPVVTCGGGTGSSWINILHQAMFIDTKRLQKILQLDPEQLFVEVESGILTLTLENRLQRQGFSLGLNELELATATVGDVIAGKKDGCENIIDLEFVDGLGRTWQSVDISRFGGWDVNHVIMGSRGTLGIITRARLRLFAFATQHKLCCWRFPNMKYGTEAMRRIMQAGLKASELKLHDEFSTLLHSDSALDPKHLLSFQSTTFLPEITSLLNTGTTLIIRFSGLPKIIEHEMRLAKKICEGLEGKIQNDSSTQNFFIRQKKSAFLRAELASKMLITSTLMVGSSWDKLCQIEKELKKILKRKIILWTEVAQADAHSAVIRLNLVTTTATTSSKNLLPEILELIRQTAARHGACLRHDQGQPVPYLFEKLKNFFDPYGVLHPDIFPCMANPREDYAQAG